MTNLKELESKIQLERSYPKNGGYVLVSYQDLNSLVKIAYDSFEVALQFPDVSETQEEADIRNRLTASLLEVDWENSL